MAAFFKKSMRSYLSCRCAIALHNGWHLEIESCNLLSIWKMLGKTTYMRLQCEYFEKFYDNDKVPLICQEIMRANNDCVKSLGKAVALDKENKNYNLQLKRTPVTMSLDLAIVRSCHMMIGDKATKEMWVVPKG
jgi:hypothetical protein